MNCKLVKVRFTYKDKKGVERFGFNFFLVFENGTTVRIEPNSYKKSNGDFVTTEHTLKDFATEVDKSVVYHG